MPVPSAWVHRRAEQWAGVSWYARFLYSNRYYTSYLGFVKYFFKKSGLLAHGRDREVSLLFFDLRPSEEGGCGQFVLVSECSNELPGLAATEAQLRWILLCISNVAIAND